MSEGTIKTNRQTAKDISREWFCTEHLEEKIFRALQIAQNRGKAIAEFNTDIDECKFCGTINNAHHSAACVDRSEAIQMEAIQHLIGRSHPSQIRN